MRKLVISKSITPREYESLGRYFREIDKFSVLSAEEETGLARQIKLGDAAALQQLTKTNLRFVISVAKQYQHQGLSLGDLINEGNIGLISAAKKFDDTKGFKFISFAVWSIREAILSAIARHGSIIRLPSSQLYLSNQVHQAVSALEQQYDRLPTAAELAEYLNISLEKVTNMVAKADIRVTSLDESLQEREQYCLHDILPNNDPGSDCHVLNDSLKRALNYALQVLNDRDRELLVLSFGLGAFSPQSVDEISRRFHITKEHVSRLKAQALKKLRNCPHAPALMACLA